jgi:penicillin-binding protein 2
MTGKIEPVEPHPLEPVPVADNGYWDTIIDGMYAVMNGPRGTARAVGTGAPIHMAGKSGTAQVFTVAQSAKYNASQVAERLRDHALFIAFGPVEDPKIAVAVIVENGESGSKVAAPIARKVMETYLRLTPPT